MAEMMDLDNVPLLVWTQLGAKAIEVAGRGQDVAVGVGDYFYDDLYSKWSQGSKDVKYEMNLPATESQPAKPDAGWKKLAKKLVGFKSQNTALGEAYSDDSKGGLYVQQDANDSEHRGTRLGENYSRDTLCGRFQFVVSRGGGMVLLNRMRRACQGYINDTHSTVIGSWKVFGEAMGVGRSDSCVAYLVDDYDSPQSCNFIDRYLWPNVKDLVADQFEPIGLIRLGGRPIWALGYPPRDTYLSVFGRQSTEYNYTSAGGMMGDVFGLAFKQAIRESESAPKAHELVAPAKEKAETLLERLG